jgi:hypothetical protein
LIVAGGVEVVFVTVTVPLAFVTTRIGATMRAVPAAGVDVEAAVVEVAVDDAVVVVVTARFRRRLPSGVAARVGLGLTADVSVGVAVVLAAVVGVAVIAAVVGVAVVLATVGVVMIAAVVGVAVVAAAVGVVVIAAVVGVADVAAAVVPVEPRTTAPPPSPVTTGIGSELIDAFTVPCGLA